jgi:anti-anti-sigma factor
MLEKGLSYIVAEGAKEGTTILTVEGPFTLGNMFQLQAEMRTMKPPLLIIDLSGVPYMDSAGLGVIMNYFVSAQGGGRRYFLAGVNDRIRALMEMTRVDAVLRMFDSVAEAEAQA